MKALIMAGGYAKRMWPLTQDTPKTLLEIAHKPIINHILARLEHLPHLDSVYVSTNKKFEQQFASWAQTVQSKKPIHLTIENTTDEKNKLGSIGSLAHFIEKENVQDDLLLIFGDNLFNFSLFDFVHYFYAKKGAIFGLNKLKKREDASKYGVVELDHEDKLIEFEEKPEMPKSSLVSTGIYILPKKYFPLLSVYMESHKNPDSFGHFINWLKDRKPVYGFIFTERWFDIGSLETYQEAKEYFEKGLIH